MQDILRGKKIFFQRTQNSDPVDRRCNRRLIVDEIEMQCDGNNVLEFADSSER
jgi:hypothetical protein